MLVFRSLTLGLLGACLFMLGGLRLPPPEVVVAKLEVPTPRSVAITQEHVVGNQITVVDVAPSVPFTRIASLVRLQPEERIVAVNDQHTSNSLEAATQIADVFQRGGKLLDLTVSGEGAGVRRVLVLQH